MFILSTLIFVMDTIFQTFFSCCEQQFYSRQEFSAPESAMSMRVCWLSCKGYRAANFAEMKFESFSSHFALHPHEHLNDAFVRLSSQFREGFNAINIGRFSSRALVLLIKLVN